MIEIALYRQRVGIFSGGKHPSKFELPNKGLDKKFNVSEAFAGKKILLWMTVLLLVRLAVMVEEVNLKQLFLLVMHLRLKLSGDVELNPGPYELLKSVQVSFNQGNVALFGETAGRQCACNALFSICCQ